jgi:sorbitol-specific phosphotransferase system component IIA
MAHSDKPSELKGSLREGLDASLVQIRASWQQLGSEVRDDYGDALDELGHYFDSLIFRISGGISVLQTTTDVSKDTAVDPEQLKKEIALCGHIGKLLLETCKKAL